MFVVVDMSDNRKRIFEKFRQHEIELKRHDVKGCAPFFVAQCHRNYTDFDELKRIISRYGVALIPQDERLLVELGSLVFEPTVLPLKMLIRTVGEYLIRNKDKQNIIATVVDDNARACDMIQFLACNVRHIRVITSRFDRYNLIAAELFASYGINLELSEDISSAYGSDVIVSLNDKLFGGLDYGNLVCYKKYSENKNVFVLDKCNLSYDKFDSERYGIDKFTFVSTLYETCGYYLPKIPAFH